MKWLKRILIGLALLLSAGGVFEFSASLLEKREIPRPPGVLVDVGGYRLHMQEAGDGDCTVVFEAGMGFPSLDWALVQPEVAKFAKTVSYDRAGLGWSDESPYPRTSEQIATELHILLEKANVPKPYILVGHSMGGIHVRVYAQKYPDEVAGLVLVDASHEEMNSRLPKDPIMPEGPSFLLSFFRYSGIQRLCMQLPSFKSLLEKAYKDYPEPLAGTYCKVQKLPNHQHMMLVENASCDACMEQVKKYPVSLGDKPLIVITAGQMWSPLCEIVGYTKEWIEQVDNEWQILQKELTALSSQGKQVIADRSDHLIPRRQPDLVVQAVKEILK